MTWAILAFIAFSVLAMPAIAIISLIMLEKKK